MLASNYTDERWRPCYPWELEEEDRLEHRRARLAAIRSRMPNKAKAIMLGMIVVMAMTFGSPDFAAARCRGGFFRGRCHRGFVFRRRCRPIRRVVFRRRCIRTVHSQGWHSAEPHFVPLHEEPILHAPKPHKVETPPVVDEVQVAPETPEPVVETPDEYQIPE